MQFNGSCEAGIGGLNARAHHLAAHFDRPGAWTSDEIEGARLYGNESRTESGKMTPAEAFARRTQTTEDERRTFLEIVEEERARERAARGLLLPFDIPQKDKDDIDRTAIAQALDRSGLLWIRRRRIPQPIYA